jgi:hypothetical protein
MFLVGLLLILVMLLLMLVPLAQEAWAAYSVSQGMVYCYPLVGANLVDRGAGTILRARHKPHRRSYHGFHHDTMMTTLKSSRTSAWGTIPVAATSGAATTEMAEATLKEVATPGAAVEGSLWRATGRTA